MRGAIFAGLMTAACAGCASDSGTHFLDVGPPADATPIPRQILDARSTGDAGVNDGGGVEADASTEPGAG